MVIEPIEFLASEELFFDKRPHATLCDHFHHFVKWAIMNMTIMVIVPWTRWHCRHQVCDLAAADTGPWSADDHSHTTGHSRNDPVPTSAHWPLSFGQGALKLSF